MKTLILYFSKTGTTARVAQQLAGQLSADLYEIKEAQNYSSADLDWTNPTSRANREQEDETARPAYAGILPDITSYDRIIIGHPTWWGRPPRIIQTVLDDLELTGKILASFSTSGGSTYAQAQPILSSYAAGEILPGSVLNSSSAISQWLKKVER
ncbi:flavodoxin [Streptococcus dentiloxodontae]